MKLEVNPRPVLRCFWTSAGEPVLTLWPKLEEGTTFFLKRNNCCSATVAVGWKCGMYFSVWKQSEQTDHQLYKDKRSWTEIDWTLWKGKENPQLTPKETHEKIPALVCLVPEPYPSLQLKATALCLSRCGGRRGFKVKDSFFWPPQMQRALYWNTFASSCRPKSSHTALPHVCKPPPCCSPGFCISS